MIINYIIMFLHKSQCFTNLLGFAGSMRSPKKRKKVHQCFWPENRKNAFCRDRQKTFLLWRRVRDSNPRYFRTQHFECCKTLADSPLEQVVSGRFVKGRKPRRRKGLRTFRPVSARADLNQPRVQIKPRSCVKSLRSCAFARSQARNQRPPTAPMKHPFGPQKRKGASL